MFSQIFFSIRIFYSEIFTQIYSRGGDYGDFMGGAKMQHHPHYQASRIDLGLGSSKIW